MNTRFQISITRGSPALTSEPPEVRRQVDVDLAARAARAGVAHLPEVVLLAPKWMWRVDVGDGLPQVGGLVVGGEAVAASPPKTVACRRSGAAPDLREQFPRPGDGFAS
jgi:hypothetical protein